MHRVFIEIYQTVSRRKFFYLAIALLVSLLCLFFISKIRFNEDISQIIPKSEKGDITAKVLRQLNFSDKIVVIIEKKKNAGDFALSETADRFLELLKPLEEPYIRSVQGKVSDAEMQQTFDFVYAHLPLFLNDEDFRILSQKTASDSIAKKVAENYESLISPTSLVTKDFIQKDPLGLTFVALKKLQNDSFSRDFKLEDQYLVSQDGRNLLLFLVPKYGGSETKQNEQLADGLEDIKNQLNKKFAGKTEISYFGSPLIAVANAWQIKSDIQKTVLVSTGLLFLLLIFYFGKWFTPLIVFIPTAFSALLALAFMYVIKGTISAISLSVSAILIGITIDYALHILTHYKHKTNLKDVYREITAPVIMSASTTAVSFLCLVFVKSEALKDLGIFAAVTVMLSAVFSLIIIPQIYTPSQGTAAAKNTIVDKIGAYPYERNQSLVFLSFAVIVLSFFGFNKIKFNNNLSDLNFVPEDIRASEAKLAKLSDLTSKSVYAIAYGNSLNEVLTKNLKLNEVLQKQKAAGNVISYSAAGEFMLPENIQKQRIDRWNQFWEARAPQVLNDLNTNGKHLGFNSAAFSEFEGMLTKKHHPISFGEYQKLPALQVSEFVTEKDGLYTISNIVKTDHAHRDQLLASLEKKKNVLAIDRQQMNENFLGLLKDDFNSLVNYSLIAVVIIFLIFFRNLDLTVFAVIPIILSGVVTAGILYFLGLELNIFSTIVCTLIFGAGVDFNIFLTQAMQKELTTGKSELPTYRVSIILALLTTVLAVGALVFAKHPALYSVSVVALVGMLAVVIISFALYPLLFGFVMKRAQKGLAPVSLRVLLNSVFSLTYYALGGLMFSVLGSHFIKKSKGRHLERAKWAVAKFLSSVLYTNPFVSKKLIGNPNEDFSRPAVVIANHTSFLDTLTMAMVTHKIVYLVNDWVYHSPIFGKTVRAMGCYPVSQGIENGIDVLQEKIHQGYSLMVFPEAERSMSNQIKRFHKGAFYLAEKYGLDIVPVYIHGNAEVMPKNDFMIHDGTITVKVGERIMHGDTRFGKSYRERTKQIQDYFRETFADFRQEIEDENYFRHALFNSFLYKEREITYEVRKDFETHKSDYHLLNKLLRPDHRILHLANDYGQMDILLALNEAGRKITSWIPDEEKRNIARQSYVSKRRGISYPDQIPEDHRFDILLISHGTVPELHVNFETIVVFNAAKVNHIAGYTATDVNGKIRLFEKSIISKF